MFKGQKLSLTWHKSEAAPAQTTPSETTDDLDQVILQGEDTSESGEAARLSESDVVTEGAEVGEDVVTKEEEDLLLGGDDSHVSKVVVETRAQFLEKKKPNFIS